ncbi:MAG: ATP-binding protein [Pseudomonadota bacterium]
MTIRRFLTYILASACFITTPAVNASELVVSAENQSYELGLISKITQSPLAQEDAPTDGWKKVDSSGLALGIQQHATWIVSEFTATQSAYDYRENWFYHLRSGNIGKLTFRHYIDGELVNEEVTGSDQPFSERTIKYRVFTFYVPMRPGEHRIEVKVQHDAFIMVTPTLVSPFVWFLDISADQLFLGGMLGILVFLALYNLGVFLVVRESVFFTFFVTFTAILALRVIDTGLGSHYVYPDDPSWHMILLRMAGGFYVAGLLFFTADYLNVKQWAPRLNLAMRSYAGVILLIVFLPVGQSIANVALTSAALSPLICAAVSAYAVYRGIPGSQTFLAGASIFTTGAVISIMTAAGILPLNVITLHVRDVSVLALGVITSLGLAARLPEEKAQKQQAELVAESKTQFLANMSHEIRTPLNAIVGFSDLLREMTLGKDQKDFVERIDRASKNLLGIINDVLDYSKMDAGKFHLDEQAISIKDLISNMRDLFSTKAEQQQLELKFTIGPDVPEFVKGDEIRLTQILTNLIGNAIKFTEHGQVTVEISNAPLNTLQFQVSDTGIGLTKEQQTRLFQPFTQADASTTRKYGGTGLGLAISKQLTELMGGDLKVYSKFGDGATFICRIPLTETEVARPKVEEDSQEKLHGLRVLVVEDNQTNQILARSMLKKCGADCAIANDGQEALDVLGMSPELFDIVLMDCQMPVMDGFAATQAIRQELKLTQLPIIAMTANALSGDREACLASGMNDYLSKPVRVNDIASMINRWAGVDHTGTTLTEPAPAP